MNDTTDSGRKTRFLLGVIAFILVIAAMREAQSLVVVVVQTVVLDEHGVATRHTEHDTEQL